MALQRVKLEEDVVQARERLKERQAALKVVQQQVRDANTKLQELETDYHQHQIPERPHSKLAKARKQLDVYQRRQVRYQLKVDRAEKWLVVGEK